MLRVVYTILFSVAGISGSFSQANTSIVAENLFSYNRAVAGIGAEEFKYLIPLSSGKENVAGFRQCLIRNTKGLYVAIVGTGRLYKAVQKNGIIGFKRIDSTVYFGSSFRAYTFSYRDTIFSLGGYGFWKTNGLLRYFIEKRNEWEIIKLNTEIPVITEKEYDLIWYDQLDGKLYFGFTREENSTTTDEKSKISFHYETMVLDLDKKEWQTLGSLAGFLKDNLNNIANITSSPWGQMISFNKKTLFLNYKENTIHQLNPDKQKIIEELPTSTGDAHSCYFKDSVFFSGISSRNLLDSLSISKGDLVLLNEKIYLSGVSQTLSSEKTELTGFKTILILLGGLVILATIILFFLRKKKPILPDMKSNHSIDHNIFTELEMEVLKTIASNSQNAKLTNIDELNKVLGVNKKNIEIQKKQRSDIITNINKKYSYIQKDKGELIERKQAEFDKRSFEYFIDYNKLNLIISLIKMKRTK
jgi:hypothetical protein